MADVTPPFDTDRFARDLPELLAGKEPVIETPAARRWLTTPEGRAAVRDVADAVAVLRGMPCGLVASTPATRRHRSSVGIAARHGRTQLGRVIRAVFVADFEQLARNEGAPLIRTSYERSELPQSRPDLLRVGERAATFLKYASPAEALALHAARDMLTASPSLRGIRMMLEVLDKLDPSFENEYSWHLLNVRYANEPQANGLLALGRKTDSADLMARCAILRGVLLWESGERREALHCDQVGVEFATRPSAALYNAALHSALAGTPMQSARYADALLAATGSDPMQVHLLREQMLSDAVDWRLAFARVPVIGDKLFEALRR